MTPVNSRRQDPAVGLSVGCTALAAVTADRAVTARPVVIRAGQPLDGFVDRVGDPVGIVAADGSLHPAATLLAEALHDLARRATAGRPLPTAPAVSYPGHWRPAQVEALRRALRRVPSWADPTLLPDHQAALAALRAELPDRGVVAVCDFGGTATTITLIDLSTSRPIGSSRRLNDFCGDAVDRAMLSHVLASAGVTPGAPGTSAIAPLTMLRNECRSAKERLSTRTVTTVPGRVAGLSGDIRVTRPELHELINPSLALVTAAVQKSLRDNGIAPRELVAVASVGGGAAMPAVTAALSQSLRVRVLTARRPALTAATGAAIAASGRPRGCVPDAPTAIVPADPSPAPVALAWSQADPPEFVAQRSRRPHPRPRLEFVAEPRLPAPTPAARRRGTLLIAAATLVVIAGAGGAAALALRGHPDPAPRTVVAVPAQQPAGDPVSG